jgi:isopentenyldiphosphate isomerase
MYGACPAPGAPPLLQVDRAAVAWFGVGARGVHANGFVRARDGLGLWVARRARGKRTFPGCLDNLVAGGSSIGFRDEATLRKECHEEAGIPQDLAARAVAVGELRYDQQDGLSWKADTLACFDLELPADFVPQPVDGEVESFALLPLADVVRSLAGDDAWKPNCALVVVHFLLRHGALDALGGPACGELWRALGVRA